MTQPAGRAAYCQSKARYCWNIFRNISPYNLMGRRVLSSTSDVSGGAVLAAPHVFDTPAARHVSYMSMSVFDDPFKQG